MENLIKPYEISLWRDVLTFVYADGAESEDVVINGHGEVIAQYYKEQKVCTIGGNNFNSPNRAVNPKLVSKINGENILTFDMYISYYDNETGEIIYNPYVNKLVNEAKIKLRYDNLKEIKWYDFLIKDIKEQSDKKIISYTAKDLFICELSKSGINLTFDDELENSIGTVHELGERVLEGSDWKIGDERVVLQEIVEEPVYLCQLKSQISGKRIDKNTEEIVQIAAGQYVYALYTDIAEKRKTIQIIYSKKYSYGNYPKNDKGVIIDCKTYEVTFTENYNEETGIPGIFSAMNLSDSYRGQRFIKSPTTVYDAKIHKYVKVYTKNGEKRYGFVETEYISPVLTQSYITNANNFVSTLGWKVNSDHGLTAVTVPDIRDAERKTDGELNITNYCLKTDSPVIYNSGIIDYRSQINNFSKNDKYVFRIKIGYKKTSGASGEASELVYTPTSGYETAKGINFYITTYTINDSGEYIIDSEDGDYYLHIWADKREGDYYYGSGSFSKSLSYSEMIKMTSSLGAFVGNPYQANLDNTIYIEDMQFFPYVQKNDELGFYLPGEDFQARAIDYYCYYNPASDYTNSDTLKLEYRGETDSSSYVLQYSGDSKFEKKRSLKATESNRFNLIQNLCEIFESWVKFEIKHDKNGRILLGKDLGKNDDDEKYRQQKYVSFHDYIKKKNYAGFKYGINLKNISRTIESEAIISKLVVKNNSNEFAVDGSCSIARSSENPSGENFLLDFSYYVQSGLIKQSTITNDLYLDNNQYLGYYKKLKDINKERDKCIQLLSSAAREIDTYTAEVEFLSADTSAIKLNEALSDFKDYTGKNYNELVALKDDPKWKDKKTRELASSIEFFKQQKKKVAGDLKKAQDNLSAAENRYVENDRILNSKEPSDTERRLTLERNELNKAFYQKYSRFIQEGNWNSEDYVDDSLYFFDALSTLHTSSQPKVTYQIDAIEISQIEGYENYVFNLGDETTIEDPEFFGWVFDENAAKTPYREEIVITELEFSLDQPEENKIKVQNYKTAFEDLFQRIAATTQSIEFSQGDYDRAAAIIQPNGTIRADVLQNSMANNTLKLQNAKEQSITWDERGIIVTSKEAPAEIVRIINGGIYLSSDGGVNWTTGITGSGINVNSIIGKHLSIDKINIFGGNGFTSFRWDKSGISAYKFDINPSTKKAENFNFGKFVRLDQYGLYGINALESFDATIQDQNGAVGEEKIWNNANFALTWKGFMLKSNHQDLAEDSGYISITSDQDFQVFDNNRRERIKIGWLGDDVYGIQIKDGNSNTVIEQDSAGQVWFKNAINIGEGALGNPEENIRIGWIHGTTNEDGEETRNQVINACEKFIVYDDGTLEAKGCYFTEGYFEGSGVFEGTITATGGTIGGVSIEEIAKTIEVVIESENGILFKTSNETKTLTARVYKQKVEIVDGLKYQWRRNGDIIEGANEKTYQVSADMFEGTVQYSCDIEIIDQGVGGE